MHKLSSPQKTHRASFLSRRLSSNVGWSSHGETYLERVQKFMKEHVYPSEGEVMKHMYVLFPTGMYPKVLPMSCVSKSRCTKTEKSSGNLLQHRS